MGGRMGLESTPGEGSRFWFDLPLREPMEASTIAAPLPVEAARITGYTGARRKVLVIDDVASNRGVVRELLEPLGFIVEEANDGEAGLETIAASPPDVVLLDMRMAPVDGAEVVRRVRSDHARLRLPIIAYSASAIDLTQELARELGCDGLVAKPFKLEELLANIGRVLALDWTHATPAATVASARLDAEDLAALQNFARRGEVAGLLDHLQHVRTRAPELQPLLDELHALAARFRLAELRARLAKLSSS